MFAGKFRSWMEAHLGRPKKNKQQKDKGKGASRGHAADAAPADRGPQSPTALTDLPASSHLHRGPLTAESLDSISTCPTTGSERGGLRPHVNLSSPESAYSTGYSTDGTSPGTSFPPEYYINLRTGTHYFHSLGAPPGLPPGLSLPHAGHPLGHGGLPHPGTLPLNLPPGLPPLPPALQPALQPHLNARQAWGWPTGLVQQPDPPRLSYLTPGRSRKQQHQQQQHQQLLLEQQQQHLHLLQQQQHQHQQLLVQQQQMYQKQQQKQQQQYIHALSRTESSTEEDLVGKAARPSSTSSSTVSSQSATSSARHWQPADCVSSVSSPRARTRIRTNPWLPTSPAPTPDATPTPRTRSQQLHQQPQQPQSQQPQPAGRQGLGGCSSSLSLSSSSSYGSASDVSLQRRAGAPGSVGAAGAAGRSRGGTRGGTRGAARPQPLFQLNEESPSVEDKPLPRLQPPPSQRPVAPPVANGVANGVAIGSGRSSRAGSRGPLRSASSSSRGAAKTRAPGRSSSCSGSSTSSASSRTANNGSPPNLSDNEVEDVEDVTLNEMMGKFDESYVYEKETDILSDSDPTDVEDYGDDGGDEQTEEDDGAEMDFIDRGSMTELCDDHQLVNRGHCTFHNFPPGRRQSSRRRAARREVSRDVSRDSASSSRDASVGSPRGSRTPSDRRRRRSAPRQGQEAVAVADVAVPSVNLNRIVMQRLLLRSAELGTGLGTRSAGSTPLSARRNHRPPPPPPAPHSRGADYALAEADREADRKYRQLIMQAEHILVSMTATPTGTPTGSPLPTRTPHYGTPPMSKRHVMPNLNRRLDYLKQGTPCGPLQGPYGPCHTGPPSHCTSPLARDRRFNDNAEENRNRWSPLVMPRRALEDPELRRKQCFTPSPSDFRRESHAAVDPPPPAPAGPPVDIRASPQLSSFQRRPCLPADGASPMSTPGGRRRGPPPVPPPRTVTAPAAASPAPVQPLAPAPAPPPAAPRLCKPFQLNLQALPLASPTVHSPVTKGWTAIEASSSESDGSVTPRLPRAILPLALDRRAKSTATTPTSSRPPLVTYKSVDHRLDMLDACPQSEPVKRKVYADSHTLDRLSKKLEHTEIMPRTPTTPTPVLDNEETHRKNMLMETLHQLKQSLESQSASLQVPA